MRAGLRAVYKGFAKLHARRTDCLKGGNHRQKVDKENLRAVRRDLPLPVALRPGLLAGYFPLAPLVFWDYGKTDLYPAGAVKTKR